MSCRSTRAATSIGSCDEQRRRNRNPIRERAMTDERDDATEAELEVAEAIGRALMHDSDHPVWGDSRFLDWLAADAREESRHRRRSMASSARMRGQAVMARAHA